MQSITPRTEDQVTDPVRVGSLCSGYGGLEMGLMAVVGGTVAWHVENDKHPSAVLETRFPGVPNYGDITTTDWTTVEPVDWLTAGYPCQPFSHAGKRKGSSDERHLWPFVADAIGALRPRRVLLENVAGHVSLGLDAVLWDLAALGYDATWGVVRAADAGAPHNRARIFIVAADTAGGAGRVGHGDDVRARRGTDGRRASTGRGAAADTDEPGRQGAESARRPVLSAWGATADATCNGRDEGRPEPARLVGRPDAPVNCPGVHHCKAAMAGGGVCDSWCPLTDPNITGGEAFSGRPGSRDARRLQPVEPRGAGVEWGAYTPAIRRWQHVIGRPAPRPTEPGRTGERLSPRFVEWLMGLPDGWVTDVLPRNPALKCLGNGVVPQQAALAVRTLLDGRTWDEFPTAVNG